MAFLPLHADAAPADPIGDIIYQVEDAADAALEAPKWLLKATLYHAGRHGVGVRDSMGCRVSAMRTLAVDPHVVPKGTVVYIKETVGLPMPGGGVHDGLWYASDVGGGIRGRRIDLFTGWGPGSMRVLQTLNQQRLTVTPVSTFHGCPPLA